MGGGASTSKFKNGTPTFQASDDWRVYDKGMLYLLRDKESGIWGFYNDTKDCIFTVLVTVEIPESDMVVPPKRLGESRLENLGHRKYRCSVTVYPTETEIALEAKYVVWFETTVHLEGLTKWNARKLRKERKRGAAAGVLYDDQEGDAPTNEGASGGNDSKGGADAADAKTGVDDMDEQMRQERDAAEKKLDDENYVNKGDDDKSYPQKFYGTDEI